MTPTRSATLPGRMSLKRPKPRAQHCLRRNCQAIAVLGCRIASGVEEKRLPRPRLDGGVERLIHVVRNGVERARQPRDCIMGIQRIGIERVAQAERPGQFRRHLPGVLGVEIEVEEVERLVGAAEKSCVAVEATP